jgi:hypothetical protein
MAKRTKKMGRPLLGKHRLDVPLVIRISPQEKAKWTRLAAKEGMKLGPWIAKPRREQFGA